MPGIVIAYQIVRFKLRFGLIMLEGHSKITFQIVNTQIPTHSKTQ